MTRRASFVLVSLAAVLAQIVFSDDTTALGPFALDFGYRS